MTGRARIGIRLALLVLPAVVLAGGSVAAPDPLAPPPNGPRRTVPGWHALVGATVHIGPEESLEGATVVLRDGLIISVDAEAPPAGARRWDRTGMHVYAGFLDAHVEVEAPRASKAAKGRHWSPKVTPRRTALGGAGLDDETAKTLREQGFTAAAVSPKGGVFRGQAALVSLAARDPEAGAPTTRVHAAPVYHTVGFDTGGEGDEQQKYPSSLMGAIALIRQTILDADWVRERRFASEIVPPGALDPLTGDAPLLFDAADELTALRAARIAKEMEREAILLGSGLEFRRLKALAATGVSVVLPLAFPKKPKLASIGEAEAVGLRELMTWERGPTNPARVVAAGIDAALTTARLEDRGKFLEQLRTAIRHGLPEAKALEMLTRTPARLLGVEKRFGSVRDGCVANLVVTDGPVFHEDSRIREVWIDGRRHPVAEVRLRGVWSVTLEPPIPDPITLTFRDDDDLSIRSGDDTGSAKKVETDGARLKITFDHEPFGEKGHMMLSGLVDGDRIEGVGERPDGKRFRWTARRTSRTPPPEEDEKKEDEKKEDEKKEDEKKEPPIDVPDDADGALPFGPYARAAALFDHGGVIVENATIWTCGPAGVLGNGILVIHGTQIVYVGTDAEQARVARAGISGSPPLVVDAKGKHVTPGVIDCHSHTGVSHGLNESGQAVTAEVRIRDVTNPDDVNWYRQLAGGVTTALTLHGSANPIGGQSQVQRLRWGVADPDLMHFEGAKPGIKFALGENVKQSNWGDRHTTRYPQTRMGVETLIRDRFVAAREYAAAWRAFEEGKSGSKVEPRRDLELEALAEVLAGVRLVHCHAYRQDEILMLCRVAEEFGFRIGTFQHALEAYKVAEVLRAHGAGASVFSDWWAYKVEVQDAIPFNAALLVQTGVLTSVNSDSSELARRLNLEAAKAVKYGGLTPEEALRLVTIHPAKQLRIDDRVGSLEVGKDADLAIWSGPPLSTRSRCESTWIEGRPVFTLEEDRRHRARNAKERQRLVQKLLASPDEEEDGPWGKKKEYECCEKGGGR